MERRTWSEEEDILLKNLLEMNENRSTLQKLKWNDIAQKINQALPGSRRTGKQCRQRWHNQLDPQIKHSSEWSQHEITTLLSKQKIYGNKWAQIARYLPGRSDNNVKNYFYSTLRRGMRRINNYIVLMRRNKSLRKQFNQTLLSKILAVADRKYKAKLDVKQQQGRIFKIAENIRDTLLKFALQENIQQDVSNISNQRQKQLLIEKIQQFNQNCKRKKMKKKVEKEEFLSSQSEVSKMEQEIQLKNAHKNNIKSNRNLKKSQSKQSQLQQRPVKKLSKKISKLSNISKKDIFKQNENQDIFEERPFTRSKSKTQPKQLQESINPPHHFYRGISDFFQQGILRGKKSIPQQQQNKRNQEKGNQQFLKKIPSYKRRDSLISNKSDMQFVPYFPNMIESMEFQPSIPANRPKESMKDSFNFTFNQNDQQPIRFRRQNSSFREYSTNYKNNKQEEQPPIRLVTRRSSLRKKDSFF